MATTMDLQETCDDSSSQIGNLLSGSWELTQKIFENLSYRDVLWARSVCRTWADVGDKILEHRRRLHYLTLHSQSHPTTHGKVAIGDTCPNTLLEGFFEHIVSKPRYCLAFCNAELFKRTDIFSTNTKNGKDYLTLSQYLQSSLPSSCEFGVVCGSGVVGTVETVYQGQLLLSPDTLNEEILSYLENSDNSGGAREGRKKERSQRRSARENSREAARNAQNSKEGGGEDTMRDGGQNTSTNHSDNTTTTTAAPLNNTASTTTTASGGVDSTTTNQENKDSGVGYSIEVERVCTSPRQADAVSMLLVPYHPGFNLKFFRLYDSRPNDFGGVEAVSSVSRADFERQTGLSPNDTLKALLLFEAGLDDDFTEAFVQAALSRQNHQLAIGGGMAEEVVTSGGNSNKSNSGNKDTIYSFGVAITGCNVSAASIVIPKTVTNPAGLHTYMKDLKSCGLPEEQSVAFMFSCCGRGYAWYRHRGHPSTDYHNVETKAFRAAFPNTPIFGFFGGGEIGMTHLPKFSERDNMEGETEVPQKRRKKKIFHQFATVFVLLSFL